MQSGIAENNALGDIPKEASVKINPVNTMIKVGLLDENGGSVNVSSPVKFFISKGQQNKHIPGTNEYKISTDAGLSKSVLTVEHESLLTKPGTGQQVGNAPIGTPD